eukprot:30802-Pelagococcus_subviridis.AAC.35
MLYAKIAPTMPKKINAGPVITSIVIELVSSVAIVPHPGNGAYSFINVERYPFVSATLFTQYESASAYSSLTGCPTPSGMTTSLNSYWHMSSLLLVPKYASHSLA